MYSGVPHSMNSVNQAERLGSFGVGIWEGLSGELAMQLHG